MLGIGLWEEAEWFGRLRKERERGFPQTKKKRYPLGCTMREWPVDPWSSGKTE